MTPEQLTDRQLQSLRNRGNEAEDAAIEIERLRDENAAHQKSAVWCDKHKPNGGARGHCVICSGIALSAALSKISYACSPPNEMEVSAYDLHQDEDAVVKQVLDLAAENAALRKALTIAQGALVECTPCAADDCKVTQNEWIHEALVQIDAAMKGKP